MESTQQAQNESTSQGHAISNVLPTVSFREIHKNAWLKRHSSDRRTGFPRKSERVWTVFCVHDDVEAFIEMYSDQKLAVTHKPDWFTSLTSTLHVSPSICGQDDEFEFAVTLSSHVLRLAAPTWELMMEWVDTIRNKLRELKVISPRENLYSKLPEHKMPLLPTRDPNSPLPLPPQGPSTLVPGVEPVHTEPSINNTPSEPNRARIGRSESLRTPQEMMDSPEAGELRSRRIRDAIEREGRSRMRISRAASVSEEPLPTPISSAQVTASQNVTVIEVSSSSLPPSAIEDSNDLEEAVESAEDSEVFLTPPLTPKPGTSIEGHYEHVFVPVTGPTLVSTSLNPSVIGPSQVSIIEVKETNMAPSVKLENITAAGLIPRVQPKTKHKSPPVEDGEETFELRINMPCPDNDDRRSIIPSSDTASLTPLVLTNSTSVAVSPLPPKRKIHEKVDVASTSGTIKPEVLPRSTSIRSPDISSRFAAVEPTTRIIVESADGSSRAEYSVVSKPSRTQEVKDFSSRAVESANVSKIKNIELSSSKNGESCSVVKASKPPEQISNQSSVIIIDKSKEASKVIKNSECKILDSSNGVIRSAEHPSKISKSPEHSAKISNVVNLPKTSASNRVIAESIAVKCIAIPSSSRSSNETSVVKSHISTQESESSSHEARPNVKSNSTEVVISNIKKSNKPVNINANAASPSSPLISARPSSPKNIDNNNSDPVIGSINVQDIPLIGGHQRRRRRSSSSDAAPTPPVAAATRALTGADRIRVNAPVQPVRPEVVLSQRSDRRAHRNEADESNPGNNGVVGVRLTLREQQVMQLRKEINHPGGVRLQLRRKDCMASIAFVDIHGKVWVAGWKQKEHPMLYNALHIGDQVMSIAEVLVSTSADAQKVIRASSNLYIEFVIRRVPFGKVFALKRSSERECLGITQEGNTAEIREIVPNSIVARSGLATKTPSSDGLSITTWFITEINGRPLNLFFKDSEVKDRLNAVGKEISILVQPNDFVKQLKKQLKNIRSYKEYIVQ